MTSLSLHDDGEYRAKLFRELQLLPVHVLDDRFANDRRFRDFIDLWRWEAEIRANDWDEPRDISQYEFALITDRLTVAGDYLGVSCPNVWAFFCEVTDNPRADWDDQEARKPTPEAEKRLNLAHGELRRLRAAMERIDASRQMSAGRGTNEDRVQAGAEQVRYQPPPCPKCNARAKVASSPSRWRWLQCTGSQCGHRWKVSR